MDIEKQRESHQKELKVLDCYESLITAIRNAGGAISVDKLGTMTIDEFIREIAGPNGIYFVARGPTNR